jgi:hypothetical protein
MAMIIAAAVWAGRRVAEECDDDQQRRQVMIFVAVEFAACAVHAIFAFYIQRRLVAQLETGEHATVSAAAKYLLKYDIGFCLYFFFAIAASGYNGYALSLLTCAGSAPVLIAAWLMFTHGGFSLCYLCCFLCGNGNSKTSGASASASRGDAGAVVVPGTAAAAIPAASAPAANV